MVSAGVGGQLLLDLGDLPAVDGQVEVPGALALGVLGQLVEHGGAVLAGPVALAPQPDVEVAGQRQGAQPQVLVADPAREVLGLGGLLAVGNGGLDGLVVVEHLDDVDHDAVVGRVDLGDVGRGVAVGQDRRRGLGPAHLATRLGPAAGAWPATAFWSSAAATAGVPGAWRATGRVARARLVPTARASTIRALATRISCLRPRRRPSDDPARELPGCLSSIGADMTAPLSCAAACSAAASAWAGLVTKRHLARYAPLSVLSPFGHIGRAAPAPASRASGRRRRSAAAAAAPG